MHGELGDMGRLEAAPQSPGEATQAHLPPATSLTPCHLKHPAFLSSSGHRALAQPETEELSQQTQILAAGVFENQYKLGAPRALRQRWLPH